MGRLRTIAPRLKAPASRITPHRPAEASRQARRALATNSAEWRRLRLEVLTRDLWVCQHCMKRISFAKGEAHVDHKDGDDSNNDMDNLQSLHMHCHSKKTAAEDRGFGNPGKA